MTAAQLFEALDPRDRQTVLDLMIALRDGMAFCIVQEGSRVLSSMGGQYVLTVAHDAAGKLIGFEVRA